MSYEDERQKLQNLIRETEQRQEDERIRDMIREEIHLAHETHPVSTTQPVVVVESLDIMDNRKRYVCFTTPGNGFEGAVKKDLDDLTPNRMYMLRSIRISSSYSYIQLDGYDGVFNSVKFTEVPINTKPEYLPSESELIDWECVGNPQAKYRENLDGTLDKCYC